jgi:outer membrane protein assembly factor BamB
MDAAGQKKWEAPIADLLQMVLMVASDGNVYAPLGQRLAAFSPSGMALWSVTVQDLGTQFPPAVAPNGTIWVRTWRALLAYGPDGTEKLRLEPFAAPSFDAPLVDANGTAYLASGGCRIHAVKEDGTEKWTLEVGPPVLECGSPVMDAKGTIYFTSTSGGLIAIGDGP